MSTSTQSTIRNTVALSVFSYASFGLSMLVQIILVRLVTPSEFGTVALAASIVSFFALAGQWGIDKAVMQASLPQEGEIDTFASTAFVIRLLYGVLFIAIGLILTVPLSYLYSSSDVILIVRVLVVAGGLSVIGEIHSAVALRDGRLIQVGIAEFASLLLAAGISVGIAWRGNGLLGLITYSSLRTLLPALGYIVVSGFRPTWRIYREDAEAIWRFCREAYGAQLISQFIHQSGDDLIVGTLAGPTQLGYYSVSFRLSKLWQVLIVQPIARVLIPAFAKLRHSDVQLASAYSFVSRNIARVIIPVNVLLAILAPEIISVFFGDQWLVAANLFRIQAVYALFLQLYVIDFRFFYAIGEPRRVLIIQSLALVIFLFVGIPFTYIWGAQGMVVTVALMAFVTFVVSNWYIQQRIRVSLWREVAGFAMMASIAALVTIMAGSFIPIRSDIATIVLMSLIYAVVYILLLMVFDHDTVREDIVLVWNSIFGKGFFQMQQD